MVICPHCGGQISEKAVYCPHCGYKQVFKCKICGEVFETEDKGRAHIAIEHENKRYVCKYCNKPFRTNDEVSMHVSHAHHKSKVNPLTLSGGITLLLSLLLPWFTFSIIIPLKKLSAVDVIKIYLENLYVGVTGPGSLSATTTESFLLIIVIGFILIIPSAVDIIWNSRGIVAVIGGLILIGWYVSSSIYLQFEIGYYIAWVGVILNGIGHIQK